jgi:hypothetical protein
MVAFWFCSSPTQYELQETSLYPLRVSCSAGFGQGCRALLTKRLTRRDKSELLSAHGELTVHPGCIVAGEIANQLISARWKRDGHPA